MSLHCCLYLLNYLRLLNALTITFAQLLHTKPSELVVVSTPVTFPVESLFECAFICVYVLMCVCAPLSERRWARGSWFSLINLHHSHSFLIEKKRKKISHAALLFRHNANWRPSAPCIIRAAFTVALFRCYLPFCPSNSFSFVLYTRDGGVSIMIQWEASIANNSWQSQTPSLINRRDRGSRLPSSPALIAAIKSPLSH